MNKKEKPKRGLVAITENDMKRKYPGSGLASDISVISQDTLWLPSRSIYLNYTMGGGIQYGKICEIFGGESSGKSLVALDFGYSAQFLGGVVLWNDAEQSFDPLWAQTNGLDLTRTHVYNETSIERISDWSADMAVTMRSKLVNNEPILLVTDSIAALDCEDNINSSQTNGKAEMGNRAKAIYRFLRTRNQLFSELGVVYIFINQLRKKVGATLFEDPDCGFWNNKINFVDGRCLLLGDIVENKVKGDVWSYNEGLQVFEPKPIIGWVRKDPLMKDEKWFILKAKGHYSRYFKGIFTGKHGILTSKGWVNVKNLNVGDTVITKYPSIVNGTLGEFLYGSFIGDSSLGYREKGSRNTARYQLQDNENWDYLNWKMEKLKGIIDFKKLPTARKGKFKYLSKGSIEFRLIADRIKYRDPLELWDLTKPIPPLTLAVWYMDDGHISKGRNQMQISIAHDRTDIDRLIEYLSNQGFNCYKGSGSKNRNPRGIKFTVPGAKKLSNYIRKYVPDCMAYKLLPEDRGFYNDFSLSNNLIYKSIPIPLISITTFKPFPNSNNYKYDLTIEDNHNFLIGGKENGFVAHNTTPGGDAMKFFASQRLAFFRKKGIYEEVNGYKVWVGNEASVRMKKNKLAPPRPSFTTNIYFNADYGRVGFGRYDNMVELMERTGVVTRKKGGSKYMLNGDTLATGADNFQEMLESNKELRSKLLRKANINTISRLQLKLERLKAKGENRYKVKAKKSRSSKIDDTE